jgi:hypothetical protein
MGSCPVTAPIAWRLRGSLRSRMHTADGDFPVRQDDVLRCEACLANSARTIVFETP